MHTPNAEIGRRAAAALLEAMRSGAAPQGLTLECDLVQRESTARAPG